MAISRSASIIVTLALPSIGKHLTHTALITYMAIYLRTYIYNNPSSKIDEFSTLAYGQKDSTLGTQEYVALMWELPFALLHMNIEPTQDQQIVDLSLNNTHFSKGE